MRVELRLRVPVRAPNAGQGARAFLLRRGFREVPGDGDVLVFARGARWARLLSLHTERWPTVLRVTVVSLAAEESGILLRYEVRSGWHLVGSLDRVVLEVEAAALEDYLCTGQLWSVEAAVAPLRRPVMTATMLNMLLAALVVVWVGLLGGYPRVLVGLVAMAVALVDGMVIMAFADIVVDGARRLPRSSWGGGDRGPRGNGEPAGSPLDPARTRRGLSSRSDGRPGES